MHFEILATMLWVFRKIKLYRRYKDMNKERIEMEIQCKIFSFQLKEF